MTIPKIVIWGASGHALVVADIIRLQGDYEIVGFLDNISPDRKGTSFAGSTILGGDDQFESLLMNNVNRIIVAFGNCSARLHQAGVAVKRGFYLAQAIHPSAVIASDVVVGPGTVIAAGAVINSGTGIGSNVIINTHASIDHGCRISDGAHICPGVCLAGDVHVGEAAWVGIGSTVMERINIGDGAVVGAGSVVLQDVDSRVLAFGVPARTIRKIQYDE